LRIAQHPHSGVGAIPFTNFISSIFRLHAIIRAGAFTPVPSLPFLCVLPMPFQFSSSAFPHPLFWGDLVSKKRVGDIRLKSCFSGEKIRPHIHNQPIILIQGKNDQLLVSRLPPMWESEREPKG
jgi:hypothetical protein